MPKCLLLPLLLLLALSLPAHAAEVVRPPLKAGRVPLPPKTSTVRPAAPPRAEYAADVLNGLWKADVERTRVLFGDESAAGPAKDPEVRLEFDVAGKRYRAWSDAAKTKALVEIPLASIEMRGGQAVLRSADGKDLTVEVVDKDTLIMVDKGVVIVRVKPKPGRE